MSTPEIRLALYIGAFFSIGVMLLSIALTRSRSKESRKPEDLPIPDEQYNFLTSHVEAVRHDSPSLGVLPAADNNIMRVTKDCLFVRTVFGRMFGGYPNMSWLAILFAVGFPLSIILIISIIRIIAFFCGVISFSEIFKIFALPEDSIVTAILFTGFLLFTVPFCIPWRRQLPIIFNRKTRKVTCWISGKARTQNWDELTVYVKNTHAMTQFGVSPVGSGVLGVSMGYHKNRELWIGVYETDTTESGRGYSGDQRAAMIWEYIRLYMEKGPAALPPFVDMHEPFFRQIDPYCFDHIREVCTLLSIKWLFCTRWYWLPIAIPWVIVTSPIRLGIFLGDIIYMGLDRVLPRRRWPKELLEACDYVWDGSNDRGPISEHAKKAYPHHPVVG